jgi:hypothetical protein
MKATITKEDTRLRSKFNLPSGIRSQIWPANTTKGAKNGVIRLGFQKSA